MQESRILRGKLALVALGMAVFGVISAGGCTRGGAMDAGSTPTSLPTPAPPVNREPPLEAYKIPLGTTPEEAQVRMEAILKEGREKGYKLDVTITPASGPETAGSAIEVAGKIITLPDDTYVETYWALVDCIAGARCPPAPYYGLARGASRITVVKRTGELLNERTAPGEEDAFDFLRAAIQAPSAIE